MTISPTATVADLVIANPRRARVFESLGLDYCCGGKRTLADACERRGLDVSAVVSALGAAHGVSAAHDVRRLTISELCDHVVSAHHDRLRVELPRLSALWEKVVRAHGDEDARLAEVRAALELLRIELEQHTAEEETALFPACRCFEETGTATPALLDELPGLEGGHESVGRLLERTAELTGGYDVAHARCNTHRAAVDALRDLQEDLHVHIHEENNVLFARVRAAAPA